MSVKSKVSRFWKRVVAATKRSSSRWRKASKAERRVIVAKDVIDALEAGAFKASHGYLSFVGQDGFEDTTKFFSRQGLDESDDLRDVLPTLPQCQGCAKAALLVCAVARQDRLTVRDEGEIDYGSHGTLSQAMRGLFTQEQLDAIEVEYECWDPAVMGMRDMTRRARLKAVMHNVVRNKGEFVPAPLTREQRAEARRVAR